MNRRAFVAGLGLLVLGCEFAGADTDAAGDAVERPEIADLAQAPNGHPWPSRARASFLELEGEWDFAPDPTDAGLAAGWATGAGEAAPFEARIRVPFPPEAKGAFSDGTPMPAGTARVVWYRRHFRFDEAWASRRVFVVFLGVDGQAAVWVNAWKVGEHAGGYAPFEIDVTDALIDGDNTLIVRAAEPAIDDASALVGLQPLLGNVTGIRRGVFLEARGQRWSGPVDVETTSLEDGSLRVTLDVRLHGDAESADTGEISLAAPGGPVTTERRTLAGRDRLTLETTIDRSLAWSAGRPTLWRGVLRLLKGGDLIDEQLFTFGAREVGVGWCPGGSPEELGVDGSPFDEAPAESEGPAPYGCMRLNGESTYLRALTWHATDPWHLGACPDGTCDAELRAIAALGFNAVRVRGTTLPPRVLAETDRLGLLVVADVPGFAEHAASPLSTGGASAYEAQLDELLPTGAGNPSVIAWTLFQEEAGLLHPPFWRDGGLTDWLVGLMHRARSLAPSALIEDNVAGGFSLLLDGSQPHLVTDVQSYVPPRGTLAELGTWLDDLTAHAVPGSAWNFVGASPQKGQPILVLDASCSAESAPRGSIAGCLPELITRLRGQERLAGFSLASFRDAPGVAPGLFDANGAPKEWGYAAFGLTLPLLLADDFVLLEPPLVRVVQPSTDVALPVGVAAGRPGPREGWQLRVEAFLDTCTLTGKPVRETLWRRDVPLPAELAFGPNALSSLEIRAPAEPGVVTVRGTLVDGEGATVAANRLHLVVPGPCQRAPSDEAAPDVVLPLGGTWNGQWSAGWGPAWGTTVSGQGSGFFKWDLYTDLAYQLADVERFALVFEAAPCPFETPLPQTDADVLRGRGWCRIFPEGAKTWFSLGDAYADARGVLSGANAPVFGWAFGDLVRLDIPIDRIGVPWLGVIRIECGVDADALWGHGLRIFDENSGRWPLRPSLLAWKKK